MSNGIDGLGTRQRESGATPAIREGALSVGGTSLFYKEAGTGSPVLLVHGGGPDSRRWSPIFEQLSRDHRVIAYDRRGYGRSASAKLEGGFWRHGEDAAELLRALDATPAQVIGWSAGGYVGIHLAVEHPELVRSLITIESGLIRPTVATASFLRMVLVGKLRRRFRGDRAAVETFMRWVLLEEDGSNTWDRADYSEEAKQQALGNAQGMWADSAIDGRPDLSDERLAKIRCPMTCVVGTVGQPWFRSSAQVMLDRIPGADLVVVPGMSHAITFHAPERVIEALRTVLRTQAER